MRISSFTLAPAFLCCLAFGHGLRASSIASTFTLGQDPTQPYNGENVGPYQGTLTGSNAINFFCMDFTLTANFGVSYPGTVVSPTTQQEDEAAFLASYSLYEGAPSSTQSEVNSVEGPISFAIWQIMGTLGNTSRDPAAQQYVQTAQYAYSHNFIPQAYLSSVLIFQPNNNSVQRFITAIPDNAMVASVLSSAVPEPGTTFLIGGALVLLALGSRSLLPGRGHKAAVSASTKTPALMQ
jgi:hypothetical protein